MVNRRLVGSGLVDQPIAFLATADWVWPALITIITWNTLPLVTLTFLASLQSMPAELVEAARVDGATSSRCTCARLPAPPHARRSSSWC